MDKACWSWSWISIRKHWEHKSWMSGVTLHQSRLQVRVLFSHFHVSYWKCISSPEHFFWDPDAPYWSFPRDESFSTFLADDCSFCGLHVQPPAELAQIYQCTVLLTLHQLRIHTWTLDSWPVLPKFLLKCWCSWHGSYARTSALICSYNLRKCPCLKKCIFRERLPELPWELVLLESWSALIWKVLWPVAEQRKAQLSPRVLKQPSLLSFISLPKSTIIFEPISHYIQIRLMAEMPHIILSPKVWENPRTFR